jgi:hypothetical protein
MDNYDAGATKESESPMRYEYNALLRMSIVPQMIVESKMPTAITIMVGYILATIWMSVLGGGETATGDTRAADQPATVFQWRDAGKGETVLLDGTRRVLRSMHAFDPSTEQSQHETYKCYHHIFAADGERLLTKGPGGLYTHHRGLFIGWNRLTLNGREFDFWHMKGVTQRHVEMVELEADRLHAVQAMRIDWCDGGGTPIIQEMRRIVVRRTSGQSLLLLDFESKLTAMRGDVLLNGDPEHAGFQFRASNAVHEGPEDGKATYMFHAERIDPKVNPDLPWATMAFGLDGHRYWVQHMNHPKNPRPTVHSAYRDYGRFGAFPKCSIRKGETVTLRYRVLVGEGTMPTRETCNAHYRDFIGQ